MREMLVGDVTVMTLSPPSGDCGIGVLEWTGDSSAVEDMRRRVRWMAAPGDEFAEHSVTLPHPMVRDEITDYLDDTVDY